MFVILSMKGDLPWWIKWVRENNLRKLSIHHKLDLVFNILNKPCKKWRTFKEIRSKLDILTLKIWSLVPSSAIGKWAKKKYGRWLKACTTLCFKQPKMILGSRNSSPFSINEITSINNLSLLSIHSYIMQVWKHTPISLTTISRREFLKIVVMEHNFLNFKSLTRCVHQTW